MRLTNKPGHFSDVMQDSCHACAALFLWWSSLRFDMLFLTLRGDSHSAAKRFDSLFLSASLKESRVVESTNLQSVQTNSFSPGHKQPSSTEVRFWEVLFIGYTPLHWLRFTFGSSSSHFHQKSNSQSSSAKWRSKYQCCGASASLQRFSLFHVRLQSQTAGKTNVDFKGQG